MVQRATAADTFADVIEALGPDAVRRLRLTVNNRPLVSTEPDGKYAQAVRGTHFHHDALEHERQEAKLEEIAARLAVRLTVEVIDDGGR